MRFNRMVKKAGFRFLMILPLTVLNCSLTTYDAGGSTGTEVSYVAGTVLDRYGNKLKNAVVRIRPADFLTDSLLSDTYCATHSIIDTVTDENGMFEIQNLEADSYKIEIESDDSCGLQQDFTVNREETGIDIEQLVVLPLASIGGNVEIDYSGGSHITAQVYGLDRSVRVGQTGDFLLMVPPGRHHVHLSAYSDETTYKVEYDRIDLLVEVMAGEQRNTGWLQLKPPPMPACENGHCDSIVVRMILDMAGNTDTPIGDVTDVENGRIVSLHLRGFDLSDVYVADVNRLLHLTFLDLGETGIGMMFPYIGRLTELEIARFDGNGLPFFSSTAGDLSKLRELNLAGNNLTELQASLLQCSALEQIDVSENRLCAMDSSFVVWLDTLDPDWREQQICE